MPKGQQAVKIEPLHRLHGSPIVEVARQRAKSGRVQHRGGRRVQERQVAEPVVQLIIAHRQLFVDLLLGGKPGDAGPLVAEFVDQL